MQQSSNRVQHECNNTMEEQAVPTLTDYSVQKRRKEERPNGTTTHKCGNTQQCQNEGQPQPIEGGENTQPDSQRPPQHP